MYCNCTKVGRLSLKIHDLSKNDIILKVYYAFKLYARVDIIWIRNLHNLQKYLGFSVIIHELRISTQTELNIQTSD